MAPRVFVHDVWDGQVANLLRAAVPEWIIITAGPGYTRRRLTDFVREHTPDVVVIAAPCWHGPHDVLVSRYYAAGIHIPLVYVVNKKLWRLPEDARQLDFLSHLVSVYYFAVNLQKKRWSERSLQQLVPDPRRFSTGSSFIYVRHPQLEAVLCLWVYYYEARDL